MGNNTTKDLVVLRDLKQFLLKDALSRKQKPTDFYNPPLRKKLHQLSNVKMTDLSWKVVSKVYFIVRRTFLRCALCAEGAIRNLMNILHCPKNDMEQF
jgi:hypothetical protein